MSCASTCTAQRIAGNPMEPKSCLARYDAAADIVRYLRPDPGHLGHQGRAVADHRARRGQVPHSLERRRRRLRRPQRNLSGVPRGDAGGEAHRQAGAAGPARARKPSPATITPAPPISSGELAHRRQGQISRPARRVAGQPRRLLLERGRAHQHRGGADQLGDQPLQGAGGSTAGTGWCSPTPRRPPPTAAPAAPTSRICGSGWSRRRRAQARHRSDRAAPAQHSAKTSSFR